jgi:hypothetical protein
MNAINRHANIRQAAGPFVEAVKLKFRSVAVMSALLPKADIAGLQFDVR